MTRIDTVPPAFLSFVSCAREALDLSGAHLSREMCEGRLRGASSWFEQKRGRLVGLLDRELRPEERFDGYARTLFYLKIPESARRS